MTSAEIREKFLTFFEKKQHPVVPSDSLVPPDDPTVLFTGAGMNQFKEYFLGIKKDKKRAASSQKCFRTGDVERVGQTESHLTFFEMLGNFSFGDYFKKEAILWGWEFMTEALKIAPEQLWASVYQEDDEAAILWEKEVGLPKERIVRFGAKDNFWPADAPTKGPNGPCGPCSEIYYDYGCCTVGKVCPDPERCRPGCSCGRFVEVWNLVFTQYDRQSDGSLKPLPSKNIDTGMGLERLVAVVQKKFSVFETDLFAPIVEALLGLVQQAGGKKVGSSDRPSIYAVADHARALTFLIADGVVPSNENRGYVLRMLLRRAARHGMKLGLTQPFLYQLVPVAVQQMASAYPELAPRRESIAQSVLTEEKRFHQMLSEKMPLLEEALGKIKESGESEQLSELAARFYDTHGLSFEEIAAACQRHGVDPPDRQAFDAALSHLQELSRTQSKFAGDIFARDELAELLVSAADPTQFDGYQSLSLEAKVVGLVQGMQLVQEVTSPGPVGVLLDRSPFYGEAGGQVGDVGLIQGVQGKLKVLDTQWVGDLLFHESELTEGKVQVGDPVTALVDGQTRSRVSQNHTATHLLHAALRKVVGSHVNQAGSLVAPDHLRFDFSHGQPLSGSQRNAVQNLVNEWIVSELKVQTEEMSLEKARESGAMALFGEKYSDQVRVVSIGDVSKELCGGTHLISSNQIGLVTIVEEGSVAAGMRRIKALSDQEAMRSLQARSVEHQKEIGRLKERIQVQTQELKERGASNSAFKSVDSAQIREAAAEMVRHHRSPVALAAFQAQLWKEKDEIAHLKMQIRELEGQLKNLEVQGAHDEAKGFKGESLGSVTLFFEQLQNKLNHNALRAYTDEIRQNHPEAVTLLVDAQGFCVAASGEKAQAQGILANELLKVASEIAGGSGGGRANLAQGKLEDPSKLNEIRQRLEDYIKGQVKTSS